MDRFNDKQSKQQTARTQRCINDTVIIITIIITVILTCPDQRRKLNSALSTGKMRIMTSKMHTAITRSYRNRIHTRTLFYLRLYTVHVRTKKRQHLPVTNIIVSVEHLQQDSNNRSSSKTVQ